MRAYSYLIASVLGLMVVSACSKQTDNTNTSNVPVTVAPPTYNPLLPYLPGYPTLPGQASTIGTVPLNIDSSEIFFAYVLERPLNNPTNPKITINLKHAGDNRYYGEVRISYNDTDGFHEGVFRAFEGVNEAYPSRGYNLDVGKYKSHYNYWYNTGGKTAFTGLFEDPLGAVVLVLENAINLGDGQGGGTISGSIWFKNFAFSRPDYPAPYSPERSCWFIYMGPHTCLSTSIINKTSTTPSDGYRRLGTFSGLLMSEAFN